MLKRFALILALYLAFAVRFSSSVVAYDYSSNIQEMSHILSDSFSVGSYIASWYDPDSNNYFAIMSCWGPRLAIVKATDPENPQYIMTSASVEDPHVIQDVKVIGNYAYAADWGWVDEGYARNLYILPLKSQYPYYDSLSIVIIPFYDSASVNIGSFCDTIP